VAVLDELAEAEHVERLFNTDGGELDDIRAEVAQLAAEDADLLAGAGDDDLFAKEGAVFEPVDLRALGNDIAEHGHSGCFESGLLHPLRHGAERGDEGLLLPMRAPADERHGRIGIGSMLQELAGDLRHALDTHEEDFCAIGGSELRVVEAGFSLRRVFMTGENGELGGVVAVGDGDSRISRSGNGAGDAGDDLEADTGFGELSGFLSATTEEHGVAAFQTGDGLALAGEFDDEGIDLILRQGVVASFFTDVDFFRALFGIAKEVGIAEVVIDEDVGDLDALLAFDGHETGITWAGADEVTDAFGESWSGGGGHAGGKE